MNHFFTCFIVSLLVPYPFVRASSSSCRCIPGDKCWPSTQQWQRLNETVHGRLIATVQLAEACHDPNYNETECAILQAGWSYPQYHFPYSAEFMAPYFQNQSCDPYTPREKPCTIGNYADYAINVTSAHDAAAGLKFAQKHNIRVVIKNTGHDYLGKSTGKGALGIWTHNLNAITFSNFTSANYTGPAVKMGAGVQAFDAYAAADASGLRVLGGSCPTVGLAGGYTQGGGHSTLSSIYGLSADQTLEWEVVSAEGKLLTASPTENADLYWALSGGGGGTYGVVLSLTAKAHLDGVVGGASLSFTTANITEETFVAGVQAWHTHAASIIDTGAMVIFYMTTTGFNLIPITIPGKSVPEVQAILQPLLSSLSALGISYSLTATSYPRFIQHFNQYEGPLPYGYIPAAQLTGGRLIPRSVVEDNASGLTTIARNISLTPGFSWSGVTLSVPHSTAGNTPGSNAVLPAWRDALISASIPSFWNFTAPLEYNLKNEDTMTNYVVPMLEQLTPGSGTYLNEANFEEVHWKENFYGVNYDALLAIKRKYDPHDLFYAKTAVGSDAWTVDGDGRLCRC